MTYTCVHISFEKHHVRLTIISRSATKNKKTKHLLRVLWKLFVNQFLHLLRFLQMFNWQNEWLELMSQNWFAYESFEV